MAEPIAALIVRILADTADMVSGVKSASNQLDGFGNTVVDVDTAVREINGAVGGVSSTYRQFDGVLQSVGINLGPQVKGLEDIASAAGKTVSQVGALGTAGLALGAGMVGWGVGRAVADFLDLDDAIAQAAAELLGYGSIAAETAGAAQDTINRAIAAGAAETISYAQAVAFLITVASQNADAYAVSAARMADAQREVRGLSEATIAAIGIAQQNGASVAEMTRHFNISADALRVLAERQRDAAKATAEHNREQKQLIDNFEQAYSNALKRKHAEEAEGMMDRTRRSNSNDEQLGLMERDARLMADRAEFDDRDERTGAAWERRYFAEQERLNRELEQMMSQARNLVPVSANPSGFASVLNRVPSASNLGSVINPTNITINAQGGWWNNPEQMNQLGRLVEDAIARRGTGPYSRR